MVHTLVNAAKTFRATIVLLALRALFRVGSVLIPHFTLRRACDLFCTPLPTRRRALCTPGRGAIRQRVAFHGFELTVYVWGDPQTQPYVLYSHGWSSYGMRCIPWVEPLRKAGYAVVSFDQPAHGCSEGSRCTLPLFANTLSSVAQHYGPPAAVIGHSLGGAAAALALASGMDAQRAILIAPAADLAAAVDRFVHAVGLPEHFLRRMSRAFLRAGIDFERLQAHRNAPRIKQPVLIAHDLEDREIPWSEGERYARFWTQSRLLTTCGLGHNRIVADQDVIDAGLQFLAGAEVGDRVISTHELPYGFA